MNSRHLHMIYRRDHHENILIVIEIFFIVIIGIIIAIYNFLIIGSVLNPHIDVTTVISNNQTQHQKSASKSSKSSPTLLLYHSFIVCHPGAIAIINVQMIAQTQPADPSTPSQTRQCLADTTTN